jgi:hypothetical protein
MRPVGCRRQSVREGNGADGGSASGQLFAEWGSNSSCAWRLFPAILALVSYLRTNTQAISYGKTGGVAAPLP